MKQIIVALSLLLSLSACLAPRNGMAITPVQSPTASPHPPTEVTSPPASPNMELQIPARSTFSAPVPTSTLDLPIGCRSAIQDTRLHISQGADYCFRYPSSSSSSYNYETHETYVVGPFLDNGSPEPYYAYMWFSSSPSAAGQTLAQAVDAVIWRDMASIADTQRPIDPTLIARAPFTRTITSIGGEPAEIVDGLSGIMSTRQAFIIHNGRFFSLGVSPNPDFEPLFTEVQPDAKAIWETVIATFAFLK